MPKPGDSPQISVRVSIRQANATPAQSAAWRRLWERLLSATDSNSSGPIPIDGTIRKEQDDGRS